MILDFPDTDFLDFLDDDSTVTIPTDEEDSDNPLDFLSDDTAFTFDDDDDEDDSLSKDELALKRHQDRLRRCGQPYPSRFDQDRGKFISARFQCNYWRECDYCFSLRVAALGRRLERIFQEHDVHEVVLPLEQFLSLRRDWKANNYVACPLLIDDQLHYVVYLVNNDAGTPVTEPSYSIETLARNAPQRNISGKLGLLPPALQEGVKVTVFEYSCPVDEQTMIEAQVDAYEETKDLNPTTVEEVKVAILTRQEAVKVQLIKRGVTDFLYTSHTYLVQKECIDWTYSPDYVILLRHKIATLEQKKLKAA
jgi:hypothetical protein